MLGGRVHTKAAGERQDITAPRDVYTRAGAHNSVVGRATHAICMEEMHLSRTGCD